MDFRSFVEGRHLTPKNMSESQRKYEAGVVMPNADCSPVVKASSELTSTGWSSHLSYSDSAGLLHVSKAL